MNYKNTDRAQREDWWRAVLASDLTAGQKVVATALGWHMNFDPEHKWYRRAWKSAGELAKEVGMSEGTVQNALAHLRKSGWLVSHGRTTAGRGSHIYEFAIPVEGLKSTPQCSQSTSRSGHHASVDTTSQCSQSTSRSGHRVHRDVDTEYIEEWTESLSDSMNESLNDSHKANEEVVFVKEDLGAFRDAYPKHAVVSILEAPYREALKTGATPEQLLTAATNYAAECKRTNQETRFIKFPTKFLNEEMWRDYLIDNHKSTKEEALSWDVAAIIEERAKHEQDPNAPF